MSPLSQESEVKYQTIREERVHEDQGNKTRRTDEKVRGKDR